MLELVLVFPCQMAALDVHVSAASADTELAHDNKENQHDGPKEETRNNLPFKRQIPVCRYARH